MNKKALSILSAGHFVTDINQTILPALLPFIKETLNISFTTAGILILIGNMTSSIIQPLFGYISDRRPTKWFLPFAPFIASLGMSLIGLVSSYGLLLICIIISGLGIASFHPEAFKTAHYFIGERKMTGMSIFSVGGSIGFAIGPIWALWLVTLFGMKGTIGFILPGILMTIILFIYLSMLTSPVHSAFIEAKKGKKPPLTKEQKFSLFFLICLATIRAWAQIGLVSYIPFYYINYLKGNPLYAGKLVTTFLMTGAIGMLIGAPIADRWGHKKFLLTTLLASIPFLFFFYYSRGFLAFLFIGLSGMILGSTFTLTTIMAQLLLPHHLGIVSGLMVGFTIGAAGIGVTLFGTIADTWGIPAAMKVIFLMPLVSFGFGLPIKYEYSLKRAKI